MVMSATVQIFSFGERWNVLFNLANSIRRHMIQRPTCHSLIHIQFHSIHTLCTIHKWGRSIVFEKLGYFVK